MGGTKIAVAGAAGFIGSHVVERLARAGHEVRAVDRPGADLSIAVAAGATPHAADLADTAAARDAFQGVERVVNATGLFDLAAPEALLARVNVDLTRAVVRAAKESGAARLVHLSSTAVYGRPARTPLEESGPKRPRNPYDRSKHEGELAALAEHGRGIGVAVLRPTLVYGPRSRYGHAQMIALAAQARALGVRELTLLRGGPRGHQVHVHDVAQAVERALFHPDAAGRAFNVADATPLPVADVLVTIAEALGLGVRAHDAALAWPLLGPLFDRVPDAALDRLNAWFSRGHRALVRRGRAPMIPARFDPDWLDYMTSEHIYDTRAIESLGFVPEEPDFRDAIGRVIEWYRHEGWLPLDEPTRPVHTIPELLQDRIRRTPGAVAFTTSSEALTWRQFGERVDALALALAELGVRPGDRVAVVGHTSGEWATTDQAILAAGGICVGIYPSLTAAQAGAILADAGAKIAFAGGADELATLRRAKAFAPALETIVGWGAAAAEADHAFDALLARGRARLLEDPHAVEPLRESRSPGDVALLIYTSGTTGEPKGAMLTHENCVFEVKTLEGLVSGELRPEREHTVSFLPMAHVGEHVSGFYSRINAGLRTHYVGSLESEAILSALVEKRPTFFGSVPRIFEKGYARIRTAVGEASPRRQAIFAWAERNGRAVSRHLQHHTTPPAALRARHAIADRLVFSKIRARFGGEVKYFISAAAPIDPSVLEFFHAAGMLVLEGYGLTESTGIATINRVDDFRFGSVGRALPGTEVRIAEDGEVLLRGKHVFAGYWNKPDATREAIDEDGWLHTGDIGELRDGWLTITDRKKNLIITAGGKNVAPAAIEALLTAEPILGPVVILGDQRPYLTALVTLDREELASVVPDVRDLGALARDPRVVDRVRAAFEKANAELARYEQVKRFHILPHELTIENGELTPTLKVRRQAITERYPRPIAALYANRAPADVVEVAPLAAR